MDRNHRKVAQFRERAARETFLRQHAEGQLILADRLGRAIGLSDVCSVELGYAPLAQIVEIAPVLDPKAPPGLVRVVLQAMFPFHVQAGQPMPQLLLVQPAETLQTDDVPGPADGADTPDGAASGAVGADSLIKLTDEH